jgi:hypothetical protein
VGAESGTQNIHGHGAIGAEQAADAIQGEAETELNGRHVEGDDQEQRVTRRAVRKDRVENADDFDLDDLGKFDLQNAGVLSFGRVERNETAACDHAGVDG